MSNPTQIDKARYSLYSAIVFIIIVSPQTYKLIDKLIGSKIHTVNKDGCPNTNGIVIQAIIFAIIIFAMMNIKI